MTCPNQRGPSKSGNGRCAVTVVTGSGEQNTRKEPIINVRLHRERRETLIGLLVHVSNVVKGLYGRRKKIVAMSEKLGPGTKEAAIMPSEWWLADRVKKLDRRIRIWSAREDALNWLLQPILDVEVPKWVR